MDVISGLLFRMYRKKLFYSSNFLNTHKFNSGIALFSEIFLIIKFFRKRIET